MWTGCINYFRLYNVQLLTGVPDNNLEQEKKEDQKRPLNLLADNITQW
jgi:hypothetical protein